MFMTILPDFVSVFAQTQKDHACTSSSFNVYFLDLNTLQVFRYNFEHKFLDDVARKICNSVRGVNRVVQDITSKPPSTIEWE